MFSTLCFTSQCEYDCLLDLGGKRGHYLVSSFDRQWTVFPILPTKFWLGRYSQEAHKHKIQTQPAGCGRPERKKWRSLHLVTSCDHTRSTVKINTRQTKSSERTDYKHGSKLDVFQFAGPYSDAAMAMKKEWSNPKDIWTVTILAVALLFVCVALSWLCLIYRNTDTEAAGHECARRIFLQLGC